MLLLGDITVVSCYAKALVYIMTEVVIGDILVAVTNSKSYFMQLYYVITYRVCYRVSKLGSVVMLFFILRISKAERGYILGIHIDCSYVQ